MHEAQANEPTGRASTETGAVAATHDPEQSVTGLDYRAVAWLALPFMINSSLQAVISLTDTWFVGQISTVAVAGLAAVYWFVLLFMFLIGGVGLAVQTLVAQAEGAGRRSRAGYAVWSALWVCALIFPVFALLAWLGPLILSPFHLDPAVQAQAIAFWKPRMLGGSIAVALWSVLGFFNGIARPRVTLIISLLVTVVNAVLNWLFVLHLHLGVAGSAWATNISMAAGVIAALVYFLSQKSRTHYRTHLSWRLDLPSLRRQLAIGLPLGIMYAADLFGFSMFQLMQVRLGAVDGAATQIVIMLTSLAYLPGVGLAMAGNTLVGQAYGAGDMVAVRRLGKMTIALTVAFMGGLGLLIAVAGPWLLPLFVTPGDIDAPKVVALGKTLLWIAAAYQIFDGLHFGSAFALRGTGDVRIPAILLVALSWGLFVPLAHALSFAPGQGWVDLLPQFGFGALGGWTALLLYIVLLALAMYLRWRSGAWQTRAR